MTKFTAVSIDSDTKEIWLEVITHKGNARLGFTFDETDNSSWFFVRKTGDDIKSYSGDITKVPKGFFETLEEMLKDSNES